MISAQSVRNYFAVDDKNNSLLRPSPEDCGAAHRQYNLKGFSKVQMTPTQRHQDNMNNHKATALSRRQNIFKAHQSFITEVQKRGPNAKYLLILIGGNLQREFC
jgi:hypothetical protein